MGFFRGKREVMWKGGILTLFKQVVQLSRNITIFYFLGKGLRLVEPLISLSTLYLGFAIPIPASIGIQETFQGIIFSVLGFTAEEGVTFSFIIRVADIIVVTIGVVILMKYGFRLITKAASYMTKFNNDDSKS